MRQVFLDTETTGLYTAQEHRIIEVAAVEVVNRRITKRYFHQYVNPEREIDIGAQEVHGISLEFLQDKPKFADIANELVDFIAGAELIIHNAPFDVGFLNYEFGMLGLAKVETLVPEITDTLKMAKAMRPGQRNNLDALCRFYGIDNSKRTLHGALLDAELLADVYMAMTRGQETLVMELEIAQQHQHALENDALAPMIVQRASEEEQAEHARYLAALAKSGRCVWQ
jgi:DNA polymerase-3 subunit epsilon